MSDAGVVAPRSKRLRADLSLLLVAVIWGSAFSAQRHTTPTHAAIILSTESVFAALAGWLVLGESLSEKQLVGCGLMLAGMLLA